MHVLQYSIYDTILPTLSSDPFFLSFFPIGSISAKTLDVKCFLAAFTCTSATYANSYLTASVSRTAQQDCIAGEYVLAAGVRPHPSDQA